MKKYAFILVCFLFALVSCASDNVEPEPVYTPSKPNPEIVIEFTGASCLVSYMYDGNGWLFIEGVEIINGAGDTRKCIIKSPNRRVGSTGKVYESGVFSVADVDEFRAWLGDNPRARVVCKLPQMWEPVEIRRE